MPGGHPQENEEFENNLNVQEDENKDIQESGDNIHQVISDIDDVMDIGDIPVVLAFTLPLLFCICVVTSKWKILVLILQTANQTWLIYLTYILVWCFSEPLWGGWLLSFCTVVYSLVTILEWIIFLQKKQSA